MLESYTGAVIAGHYEEWVSIQDTCGGAIGRLCL